MTTDQVIDIPVKLLNRDNDKNAYKKFEAYYVGKPGWILVGGDGILINKNPTKEELKQMKCTTDLIIMEIVIHKKIKEYLESLSEEEREWAKNSASSIDWEELKKRKEETNKKYDGGTVLATKFLKFDNGFHEEIQEYTAVLKDCLTRIKDGLDLRQKGDNGKIGRGKAGI